MVYIKLYFLVFIKHNWISTFSHLHLILFRRFQLLFTIHLKKLNGTITFVHTPSSFRIRIILNAWISNASTCLKSFWKKSFVVWMEFECVTWNTKWQCAFGMQNRIDFLVKQALVNLNCSTSLSFTFIVDEKVNKQWTN